jgi:hypothetical protein
MNYVKSKQRVADHYGELFDEVASQEGEDE